MKPKARGIESKRKLAAPDRSRSARARARSGRAGAPKADAVEAARAPSAHVDDARKAYTVRVSNAIAAQFDRMREGRKFGEVGEEAVKLWIEKERQIGGPAVALELRESLAETLLFAVVRQLRENPAWAHSAIQAASLLDPFISLYVQRVSHFREEKLMLTREFVPWFVDRALHYAKTRSVIVVVESGTTLKDALDEIGPSLAHRLELVEKLRPGQIEIVTNNFPGAESYEAYASTTMCAGRPLGEIVPCHLVPGKALRAYAAIVGQQAEEYLFNYCRHDAKKPPICLGLVASNWVLLEGQTPSPTLLARGKMHRTFKEAVLDVCEEAFLISPLCKMVQANPEKSGKQALDQFNHDFVVGENEAKGAYERVQPKRGIDPTRLKVVTTTRTSGKSIVYPHATIVRGLLRTTPQLEYHAEVAKPIAEVPHFIYPHDLHSNDPVDDQLKIELPHERTRDSVFRTQYFHIGS